MNYLGHSIMVLAHFSLVVLLFLYELNAMNVGPLQKSSFNVIFVRFQVDLQSLLKHAVDAVKQKMVIFFLASYTY